MKKIWIVISIFLISSVFIYYMIWLSSSNTCSWIRVYDCQKNIVSWAKYLELKKVWDLFLNECKPNIIKWAEEFIIDYSNCNLKVKIWQEKPWVNSVEVNWIDLSREEINNKF